MSPPRPSGTTGLERGIAGFWESNPCGDREAGGLAHAYEFDYGRFFEDYDRHRYAEEAHIPSCLDRIGVFGKRVLEIGIGEGAEAEQLIRRGALWTGLELTAESVRRVRHRMRIHRLCSAGIFRGSATNIPAAAGSFDVVFSHGVLHHVPDLGAAQREIHRVMRPGGRLVMMVYARWSLNYYLAIALLRRLGLLVLWPARRRQFGGKVGRHLENAAREGLRSYLRMSRFIHASTDGPDNPYSQVYDVQRVCRAFPLFKVVRARKYFMHAPPLPVHRLPGARLMGWHLWVELERRDLPNESPSTAERLPPPLCSTQPGDQIRWQSTS